MPNPWSEKAEQDQDGPSGTDGQFLTQGPSISLPNGGGAIRGIGEKFAADPVTGAGSMSFPIPTSPGRAGFGPQLSLSYSSGYGNGPFGFGWSLNLPHIARKTDKGLPQYDDASESDVFLLSGAEDLVPVLEADTSRFENLVSVPGYAIHRYRPRIEGLFARIERWTRLADGDVHWRSISRDNVLTIYGKDNNARIHDPNDRSRIFSWLICETRDDKGNVIVYGYKPEDGAGIDLSQAHERNRGPHDDPSRSANRYIKRIRYGNRMPMLDTLGQRPRFLSATQIEDSGWMFELVFDYGEHDALAPRPDEDMPWTYRADAFSHYRAGFEVRTARRAHRVLMIHHFEDEPDVGNDCLVRSVDLGFSDEIDPPDPRYPIHSFLRSVTQCGYRREDSGYLKRSLPPLEFEYSVPLVQDTVQEVDATSLEHLPVGIDGTSYQWADLHGEGIPGLLTEQAGALYYKRNLSPVSDRVVEFAPFERVDERPNFSLANAQAQLMDLAGDGTPDMVVMEGPTPGFHEHDGGEGWGPFRTFPSHLHRDTRDPKLRFIDLDGDGRADALITEDDAFVWHASLGEDGFGPARRVRQALDEESGPRLVFAEATQSIFLADMSGDGLTDLVRIRNGEICYWPNLGHGHFGTKVTMDQVPRLDRPDRFDPRRLRLADIDGSGGADLIYLAGDGVTLYFNQSGNRWSAGQRLASFPAVDNVSAIKVADLKGNGTACLVWSSPLSGHAARSLRYVDLMGGQKPHLLVRSLNNLGAETVVHYAPSTKFYLADKLAGRPWITRLPFPVHLVDRVESFDRISANRFVTRYAYHHGHFDGAEREFRGFGMVEQWDTEEISTLTADGTLPDTTNFDAASHVPPVYTKSWFHTGAYLGRNRVSNFFAGLLDTGDSGEYYRETGLDYQDARALLLDDTVLPPGLTFDEEREACRALKGAMLRREVYALDGSDKEPHPYTVSEQNFSIRVLQARVANRHAVFLTHAREAITYQYERNPADPRVAHALTLEVDDFGNVLKSAAVAYGRRQPDATLSVADQDQQAERHVTCSENDFTNAIDSSGVYRTPLPSESRSYELAELELAAGESRLGFDQLLGAIAAAARLNYEEDFVEDTLHKRLIEHVRTQYRPDDLGTARADPLALLPPGQLESLALPGESYKLAFTPGLIAKHFGNLVSDDMLEAKGRYVHSEGDADWWLRSGRAFLSPLSDDDPASELTYARLHFFRPQRFRDPFHRSGVETEAFVEYDVYNLAVSLTRDALGNQASANHDYRVLQPRLMTDPNGNRSEVAFDALGMVVGTAVMGKEGETKGDALLDFTADLDETTALAHLDDPLTAPHTILQQASTRMVYDLFAYLRTRDQDQPRPTTVYTLARETHDADLTFGEQTRVEHSFSYSDGFGREIQKKIQAEPGPLVPGGEEVDPRWVGSGWTVSNNKGEPVRQYEPFFSTTHGFEFARVEGVSPVLFYDPLGRVVATLHPNHTWERIAFDSWRQENWDVNDTVLFDDPREVTDVADYFRRLPDADYLPGWHAQRENGAMGPLEQAAADKAAVHAGTPNIADMDSLGRTFVTMAHNRFKRGNSPPADPPEEAYYSTRIVFDIEGNQREVIDALGRIVMRYDYDMLGNRVHSSSMEAGERWMLNDVAGKAIYGWDSREHRLRTSYDELRRPSEVYLQTGRAPELLVGHTAYGESQAEPEANNLRGVPFQLYDGAGVITTAEYDFKGNALTSSRQFAADYKTTPDWSASVTLEQEVFTTRTTFDALNRPVIQTTPDNSITRRSYNESGLLQSIDANLRGETVDTELIWTPFVTDVEYNAKGQRECIVYGNGIVTSYDYDPLTFRLIRLLTLRGSKPLQELSYTYDPAGNITHIEDNAQQTLFFRNRRVEPSNDYLYDATYQLIEASGREHLGQANGPTPPDAFNSFPTGLEHPGDGNAMGLYLERYVYDAVGNFLETQHIGSDPAHPGWTRAYNYAESSLIESERVSNRLSSTRVGNGVIEPYTYDAHGSMTSMPHLSLMQWNYRDQLEASARQIVVSGTPETTWYVYDATGQRVRKVIESAAESDKPPTKMMERIYLGAYEGYREYGSDGNTLTFERESLHVMDGNHRIALSETQTVGDSGPAAPLIRHQISNHLGSASLELDDTGQVISYEENFPFGDTSYQAMDASISTAAKRYRYMGKERDKETGLYYHGARYFACWLGRWLSTDQKIEEYLNMSPYYAMGNNPAIFIDPDGQDIFIYQLYSDGRVALVSSTPSTEELHTVTYDDPMFISSNYTPGKSYKSAHKKYYRTLKRDYSTKEAAFSANLEDFSVPYHGKPIRGLNTVEHFTIQGISNIGEESRGGTPSKNQDLLLQLSNAAKKVLVNTAIGNKKNVASNPTPLEFGESIDMYEPPTSERPEVQGVIKAPERRPIVLPAPPEPKRKPLRKKEEGELPTFDDEPQHQPFVEDRPGPSIRIKYIHDPYTLGTIDDLRKAGTSNPRSLDNYD